MKFFFPAKMSFDTKSLVFALTIGLPALAAVFAALGWRGRDVIVGIDLGTTFSALAYRGGGVAPFSLEPRALREGTLASLLAVGAGSGGISATWMVGEAARAALSADPLSALADSKRVIGRAWGSADAVLAAERRRAGGRLIAHPLTQRDAFGKVQTGAKLRLCRTCAPEPAFLLRTRSATDAATLAAHSCIDARSLLTPSEAAAALRAASVQAMAQIASAAAPSEADGDASNGADAGSDSAPQPASDFGESRLAAAVAADPSAGFLAVTPTAAACLVVRQLMAGLRRELGHGHIKAATVTIPAEFDGTQRAVTVDAYIRAGVRPGRVLHEPAAAAIAYGLHRAVGVHHVLVFDMGGGTLDVSVLYASEGAFTVIGSAGDAHLGGEDFDDCLLRAMAEQLRLGEGVDVFASNKRATDGDGDADRAISRGSVGIRDAGTPDGEGSGDLARREPGVCSHAMLRGEAERVKIALSGEASVPWRCRLENSLDSPPVWAEHVVSISDFEAACAPLFERALEPVHRGLANANLAVADVDEVVLVGGSSRLGRVRELLQAEFRRPLRHTVDPDLAVAFGAAMVVD